MHLAYVSLAVCRETVEIWRVRSWIVYVGNVFLSQIASSLYGFFLSRFTLYGFTSNSSSPRTQTLSDTSSVNISHHTLFSFSYGGGVQA